MVGRSRKAVGVGRVERWKLERVSRDREMELSQWEMMLERVKMERRRGGGKGGSFMYITMTPHGTACTPGGHARRPKPANHDAAAAGTIPPQQARGGLPATDSPRRGPQMGSSKLSCCYDWVQQRPPSGDPQPVEPLDGRRWAMRSGPRSSSVGLDPRPAGITQQEQEIRAIMPVRGNKEHFNWRSFADINSVSSTLSPFDCRPEAAPDLHGDSSDEDKTHWPSSTHGGPPDNEASSSHCDIRLLILQTVLDGWKEEPSGCARGEEPGVGGLKASRDLARESRRIDRMSHADPALTPAFRPHAA